MMEFKKHEFIRQTIDMKETGWNLRKAREGKNIPVTDVSKYLGTSIQSVYNWEIGKTEINIGHLVSLCEYYNIKIDDVICRKEELGFYSDYEE